MCVNAKPEQEYLPITKPSIYKKCVSYKGKKRIFSDVTLESKFFPDKQLLIFVATCGGTGQMSLQHKGRIPLTRRRDHERAP